MPADAAYFARQPRSPAAHIAGEASIHITYAEYRRADIITMP